MHNAAIFGKGRVDLIARNHIKTNYEINIIVAMRHTEIGLTNGSLVWSDINLDKITFDFIANMIYLILTESNNKILQTISSLFESFFWFQKLQNIWYLAGKDRGDMLVYGVKNHGKTERGGNFVDIRIFGKRNQNIFTGFNFFDYPVCNIANIIKGRQLASFGVFNGISDTTTELRINR